MSELILKGFDLFLNKTHSAGKLFISPEITETVFLVMGFLLVFAGAKLYRLVISLVMFIGVTLVFCTLLDGRAGWGTIVTAFTILGCLLGFMAFSWKTADAILFAGMAAAAAAWMWKPSLWAPLVFGGAAALAAGFYPLEGAILTAAAAGGILLWEAGVNYAALFAACGFLLQVLLFERKSERGQRIWKRFFAKKSNT